MSHKGSVDAYVGVGPVEVVSVGSVLIGETPRLDGNSDEYVQLMAESADELPPIVVHRDTMRVIDGAHRLCVAKLRHEETIKVRYFDGSAEEAFVLAVRSNVTHGLPLSVADRKAAAVRIIRSYPHWSDRAIASSAGLAPATIAELRVNATPGLVDLGVRIGRDGRVRPVDGAARRERAMDFIAGKPSATLREICEAAGISLNTARDVRNRFRRGDDALSSTQRRDRRVIEGSIRNRFTEGPDVEGILRLLRNDPSLRGTEKGRILLRFLGSHATASKNSTEIIDTVPAHWADVVADVALECSRIWAEFGEQLRTRQSRPA